MQLVSLLVPLCEVPHHATPEQIVTLHSLRWKQWRACLGAKTSGCLSSISVLYARKTNWKNLKYKLITIRKPNRLQSKFLNFHLMFGKSNMLLQWLRKFKDKINCWKKIWLIFISNGAKFNQQLINKLDKRVHMKMTLK